MRRDPRTLVLPLPQSRFKTSSSPWLFSTLLNFVMHPSLQTPGHMPLTIIPDG
jgi:hypothetical protein